MINYCNKDDACTYTVQYRKTYTARNGNGNFDLDGKCTKNRLCSFAQSMGKNSVNALVILSLKPWYITICMKFP
jgi:hypothetical protein